MVLEFAHSEKLQRHVQFLYSAGGMYLRCNGNLLYHGCIPMEKNGDFAAVPVHTDEALRGREAIDAADVKARQGYFSTPGTQEREDGQDFLWYLGSGPNSPLFGKDKMATFERYFVADKATHVENKNPYYDFQNDEQTALRILERVRLVRFGVHHQRPCAGQARSGRKPDSRRRPPARHRRRPVPRVSAGDGHRGVYAHLHVA